MAVSIFTLTWMIYRNFIKEETNTVNELVDSLNEQASTKTVPGGTVPVPAPAPANAQPIPTPAPHAAWYEVQSVGKKVKKGEILGVISDPFGIEKHFVRARKTGIVIGITIDNHKLSLVIFTNKLHTILKFIHNNLKLFLQSLGKGLLLFIFNKRFIIKKKILFKTVDKIILFI